MTWEYSMAKDTVRKGKRNLKRSVKVKKKQAGDQIKCEKEGAFNQSEVVFDWRQEAHWETLEDSV